MQLTTDAVNKISIKNLQFCHRGGGAQFSSLSKVLKTLVLALVGVTVAFLEPEVRNYNNNLVRVLCSTIV